MSRRVTRWALLLSSVVGAACAPEPEPPGEPQAVYPEPPRAAQAPRAGWPSARATPPLEVTPTATCALLPPPRMSTLRWTRGVTYGRVGSERLRLDLMVPDRPGPHPLVVLLHGGSWRRGRREYMRHPMRLLSGHGYATAAVGYRLADDARHTFPAAVEDVRCAVRWLRWNASVLDVDPDRIAVVGFSAGAHLAAMLGTAAEVEGLDGQCPLVDVSPRVQAVVAFYGPYDIRPGQLVGHGSSGTITNFLGGRAADDPERAALASPLVHVDAADAPTMLVHGLRDRVVDVEQARAMHTALRTARVPSLFVELERGPHGFSLFPPRPYEPVATCTTLAFLSRTLGVPPAMQNVEW